MNAKLKLCGVLVGVFAALGAARAEDVRVAVAANFTAPIQALAPAYEKATGDKLIASFGGTGAFYAQIRNGAPFDVLLAADDETPAKAVKEGFGVEGSIFTYAIGKLVLWSADANLVKDGPDVLKTDAVRRIALANPKLAPYGLAGRQALKALGLEEVLASKIVEGDNIGKTFQFVKTGNAEAGFVALSQCSKDGAFTSGSGWVVPAGLYEPIRQDAVLLRKGEKNAAAKRFLEFLRTSPEAADVRASFGYDTAE